MQPFQVVHVNAMKIHSKVETIDQLLSTPRPNLTRVLRKYDNVFQEELLPGFQPKMSVDDEFQVERDSKAPHRPLYQLPTSELGENAMLLRKGKNSPSKSPYGASLFFVKRNYKPLRAVLHYSALNHYTKRNNAPLSRLDEIFEMIGEVRFFSKLDLESEFHQIRVQPEDMEKTLSVRSTINSRFR